MHYFNQTDYNTFAGDKPFFNDDKIQKERNKVRQKLLNLDSQLWPFIQYKKWDLHRHRNPDNYVSSIPFAGFSSKKRWRTFAHTDMWLHYGKSPEQLNYFKQIDGICIKGQFERELYNAFYLHTRIEFLINSKGFKCSLVLATNKNYLDKSEFLKKIRFRKGASKKLLELLESLFEKNFFYEIGKERFYLTCNQIQDEEEESTEEEMSIPEKLLKFIKSDKQGVYSGIVKEYEPYDPALDGNNIVNEMKENLELLYPVYDFMAWRPS